MGFLYSFFYWDSRPMLSCTLALRIKRWNSIKTSQRLSAAVTDRCKLAKPRLIWPKVRSMDERLINIEVSRSVALEKVR